jgi:hypothetical protein
MWPQKIKKSLRNFLNGWRVYVIDAKKMTFDLSRHLQFILGQRSRGSSVASLIFLTTRVLCAEPVPGNPAGVAALNDQDNGVGG